MSKFEFAMTVINTIAIIIIPIVAIFIGQKLQDRSQKRKDKLEIFRLLMMYRGLGWSVETVRALNIIEIVFSDDKNVMERWKEYYDLLGIQSPDNIQFKKIKEAQYKLLEAMACSLGYKKQITWETIQNPYVPKGMCDAIQQQQNIQDGQERLAGMVDFIFGKKKDTNTQPSDIMVNRSDENKASSGSK